MKKTILFYVAFLLLVPAVFSMSNGCACAAGNLDMGFPMYPGAKVNPAYPPIDSENLILTAKRKEPRRSGTKKRMTVIS
jgi:hypothetical protein